MEFERVQFDTNVAELVDANERFWKRAPAGRAQRRRGIAVVAALFTISVFTGAFLAADARPRALVPVALVALVLGAVCWPLYGRLYDRGMHRRFKRVLTDQLGGEERWTCEIELRPEGVWTRSRGVDMLFHWRELTAMEVTDQGVEFYFKQGFVIARSRAFAADPEHERFVQAARALARAAGSADSSPTQAV